MKKEKFNDTELTDGQRVVFTPYVTTSDLSGYISTSLNRWQERDGILSQYGRYEGTLVLDWIKGAKLVDCKYLGGYSYRQDCKDHHLVYLNAIKVIPFNRVVSLH